jgi:hypothetical protein
MRAQLRCSPRTMFDCIQSSRDTQPELVADDVAACQLTTHVLRRNKAYTTGSKQITAAAT